MMDDTERQNETLNSLDQPGEAELAPEETPAEGEEPAPDPISALRQELDQARAKEAEYLEGWQRARAELANARKRFQREQEQVYSNAKADVMVQLLPIADDFARAFETLPANLSQVTWIEGLMLIQRKLQWLLERSGVVPIEVIGQEFTPTLHEAISHEPSTTVPAGQIIAELQKGYQMGDRVLRPSLVRVSAGPPPQPDSAGTAEAQSTPPAADQVAEEGAGHPDEQS
jgi:molecular chaperone GrpE